MVDISSKELNAAKNWYYKQRAKGERGMFSEFVDLDPAKAQVILEHNPDNRNISPATVDRYASDMKSGRWRPNGEAIILAESGDLNTGQHRLKAILKSGKTILSNIVFGAKREDRYTIDTGRIQTAGDKAMQKGIKYGTAASAIAGAILAHELYGGLNVSRVSKIAILDRISSDERIQSLAAWTSANSARLSALRLGKKVAGLLYYRAAEINPAKADEFMNALSHGASLSDTSPIFVLRERLMTRNDLKDRDKMELFARAWNAWATGQEINSKFLAVRGNIPELKKPKS